MGLGIKKGDTVVVLSGGEDKGKRGKVLAVMPKKSMALVEGLNMISKHARAKSQQEPGGIIQKEAPIRLSKLMLVDPKSGIAGRFSNVADENGNKIRRSKRTKNEV